MLILQRLHKEMNYSVIISLPCLLVLAAVSGLVYGQKDGKKKFPEEFPEHCACTYKNPSGIQSCKGIEDPSTFPAYNTIGFTSGDCVPSVPANHRVCYRTNVRDCNSSDGSLFYTCRLFAWKDHYRLASLTTIDSNQTSSVTFESLNNTESRTLCFYNISVAAETSENNCSGIRLQHVENHPEEKYVDRLRSTNADQSCKSYVSVDDRTLCREKLAHLDITLRNVTSTLVIYWTNNDRKNKGSFRIRAQCQE